MAIYKKNISNLFYIYVSAHLIIWTLVPSLTNNNLPLDTLQIKGGSSGIQIIDSNNNSLMDLDNTQISINKPLVCSSTGYFTGNVTASSLYNKTEIDSMIGLKHDVTTDLTNLLSIFTVGGDSIGIKNSSPATAIASLNIDSGLIVKSLNDNLVSSSNRLMHISMAVILSLKIEKAFAM